MYSFQRLYGVVLLTLLFGGLGLGEAGAESPPYLVSDINPILPTGASGPHNLTTIGSTVYFSASTSANGCELWKSDGSEAGTVLVSDIRPGEESSDPQYLVDVNGTLFFAANDGTAGYEVWKSDPLTGVTELLQDICPGAGSANPMYLTNVNGTLFFSANDGTNGVELWKSDGTALGTTLINIHATSNSLPVNLKAMGTALFFAANNGSGVELWKSDTVTGVTEIVKDINTTTASASSSPANLAVINGLLYFAANNGTNGVELWMSDGIAGGSTVLLRDINTTTATASSSPANLTEVNGVLYFTANNGTNGVELWKSDGLLGGVTEMARDINTTTATASSSPANLTNVGGVLFFTANDGINGIELWRSDAALGATMVKDIYPTVSTSYYPSNLADVGGLLYFSANDGTNGYELWKSDGTNANTVMVANLRAGSSSSSPSNLKNVNGTLFFQANDGIGGNELWRSNGTAAGTFMVRNIADTPGSSDSSSPAYPAIMDGFMYFRANDGTTGAELWKSDGTDAGTMPVKDIWPGGSGSAPAYLTNVNGTLYFQAEDGVNDIQLWKSDGTGPGTVMVKEINPSGDSSPTNLLNMNGVLFFSADDGANGRELWTSDGTNDGTFMVADINPAGSSSPGNLTVFNNTLFFSANDGANGVELWSSDGTPGGTVMVKDIHPAGSSSPAYLTVMNGMLYFQATNAAIGAELWKSDGTDAGTTYIDIRSGANSSTPAYLTVMNNMLYFQALVATTTGTELYRSDGSSVALVSNINTASSGSSSPANLTVMNNRLYFQANDGINGVELWQSDGAGPPLGSTTLLKNINPGVYSSSPQSFINLNGTLFFLATDGMSGTELWKTDGTPAGTTLVKEIFTGAASSSIAYMTNFNDTLFFAATDLAYGAELWTSDGSASGTALVKDINANPTMSSSSITLPKVANGMMFFQANDGATGAELWRTDGTPGGTMLLKDIYPGVTSSTPDQMGVLNGIVYFRASDAANGQELWRSDGTPAGTVLVRNIRAGASSSSPAYMTGMNGKLYFRANEGTYGYELWMSTGEVGNATRLKDINPGANASNPAYLANINGTLYFQANDGVNGLELWKSDGLTDAGTVMVANINPGNASSSPNNFTEAGGLVYFTATDGVNGVELWKSDGTAAGTVMAKDINASAGAASSPANLTNVNGVLFFTATDGINGVELWKSDPVTGVTEIVKDINTAAGANSSPATLTNVNGLLYFRANDGIHGNELWRSDGTEAGTVMVADLYPGNVGANPTNLCAANGVLYFNANDGTTGFDIWMSRGTLASTVPAGDVNPGAGCSNPTGITALGCRILFAATDGSPTGNELWAIDVPPDPILVNPSPVEVGGGPATINASTFTPGVTGLCEIASVEARRLPEGVFGPSVAFSCTDIGAIVDVEVVATGDTGQSTMKTVPVTVVDTTAPSLTPLNPGPVNVGGGPATIETAAFVDSVSDPCDASVDLAVRRLPDGTFGDDVSFDCADANTTVDVEVRAVDDYNNTTIETVQVSVADATAPSLTTLNPGPVNVGGGPATIATAAFVDSAADLCDTTVDLAVRRLPDGTFGDDVSFDCADANTTVDVEVRAVDDYNNTTIETVQVSVADATAPSLATLNPGPVNVGDGPVTITTAAFVDSVADPCDAAVDLAVRRLPDGTFGDDVSFDCADANTTVDVEVRAVDDYNNTTIETVQVSVADATAPSLATLNPGPVNVGDGPVTITTAAFVDSVADPCDAAVDLAVRRLPDGTFGDDVSFDCADANTTVDVEVSAVDNYGNTTIETVQVAVVDTTAPSLTTLDPSPINVGYGSATMTRDDFVESVTDTCDTAVDITLRRLPDGVFDDTVSFDCADAETTVDVEVLAMDVYSNTTLQTVQVYVEDSNAPILVTKNPGAVNVGNGPVTVPTASFLQNVMDYCDSTVETAVRRLPGGTYGDDVSFSCTDAGATVSVQVRAVDEYGNTAHWTVQVSVVDTVAPSLTTKNPGPVNTGSGSATVLAPAFVDSATDTCDTPVTVTVRRLPDGTFGDDVSFSCADVGATVDVEVRAADGFNNAIVQMVQVAVVDSTAPVLTTTNPGPINVGANDVALSAEDFLAAIQEPCGVASKELRRAGGTYGASLTFTCADAGSTISIELLVTDDSGNASTGTVPLSVVDAAGPEITRLGDASVIHECSTPYHDLGATASDHCEGNLTGQIISTVPVSETTPPGTYTVRYNVLDNAGNPAVEVTRTVTVVDTQRPAITLLGTPTLIINRRSVFVDPGATAFDDCEGNLTSRIVVGGDTVNTSREADYTLTYNVTDAAGNPAPQLTRVVTVVGVGGPPVILVQPQSASVLYQQNTTFSVLPNYDWTLAYRWYKNGFPLSDSTDISGATERILTVLGAENGDEGAYTCVLTNEDGSSTSNAAYLRVQDPAITVQPVNTAVTLGAPATFSITAVGTAPMAYQWYKAGSPETLLVDTAGKISGATTDTLTIFNARKTDQGLYFCKVTGVDGTVWSSSARLYAGDPAIEIQPQSQTSSLGSTVVFEVTARGTWPIYYQWMKNGVTLANDERISGVLTRTLTITNVTSGDAAGYSVVVSGVTSVISATATLSLGAPPIIDSVVTTPAGGKVHISGYAAFAVITAGGDQPFTYQWYKNGQPLTNDARINGANAPILSISEIEPDDAAYYTVQVSNSAGADTSDPVRLSVGLQFARDLSDITVTSGRPVDWPVEITGAIGNISFQWYKVDKQTKALVQVYDGGPVSGSATKCLHFIPVAPEHAGDYQVEVSDDFDTVLSGEGTLNVVDGVPLLGMTGLAVLGGVLAALGARNARRRRDE